jgi:hypothetical protein
MAEVELPASAGFELLQIVRRTTRSRGRDALGEAGRRRPCRPSSSGRTTAQPNRIDPDTVRATLAHADERQDLNRRCCARGPGRRAGGREFITGPSRSLRDVLDTVQKVARLSATVLILGESGTGKELLARRSTAIGPPDAPFVAVNMAAIPRDLVESTLFGHEKGSFTGALQQQHRQVRAGQRRHAVPRRDRRPAARPAGQAAARDSGRRDRARRRHPPIRTRRSASSPPPTWTSSRRSRRGRSARTCSTA